MAAVNRRDHAATDVVKFLAGSANKSPALCVYSSAAEKKPRTSCGDCRLICKQAHAVARRHTERACYVCHTCKAMYTQHKRPTDSSPFGRFADPANIRPAQTLRL